MTTAELKSWVQVGAPAVQIFEDELPYEPSKALMVTLQGGRATRVERGLDVRQVLIQARDVTPSQSDALMAQVDNYIMSKVPPVTIGVSRVISIDYAQAPPLVVGLDEEDRRVWEASYLLWEVRTVL